MKYVDICKAVAKGKQTNKDWSVGVEMLILHIFFKTLFLVKAYIFLSLDYNMSVV